MLDENAGEALQRARSRDAPSRAASSRRRRRCRTRRTAPQVEVHLRGAACQSRPIPSRSTYSKLRPIKCAFARIDADLDAVAGGAAILSRTDAARLRHDPTSRRCRRVFGAGRELDEDVVRKAEVCVDREIRSLIFRHSSASWSSVQKWRVVLGEAATRNRPCSAPDGS